MTSTTYAPGQRIASERTGGNPEKRTARLAGLLYLVIFFANIFAYFFVSESLTVPGDAAATARNIMASEPLYRAGFAAYLIVFLSDIGIAVLLYGLLKPVSQSLALLALVTRLAQTAITGINMLFFILPLMLLGGADYLAAFGPEQLQALSLLSIEAHAVGVLISEAFFALHTAVLAYLIYKSELFPRILGILMVFASLAYVLDSFGIFLFPAYEALIADAIILPTIIGEFSFTLWLLIKGVREPEPAQAAVAAA